MNLQNLFFEHIVEGGAEKDRCLLARVALHLGYDSDAYPVSLSEITNAGQLPRNLMAYGLSEMLLGEYLRSAAAQAIKPWSPEEVARLRLVAGVAPRAKLYRVTT